MRRASRHLVVPLVVLALTATTACGSGGAAEPLERRAESAPRPTDSMVADPAPDGAAGAVEPGMPDDWTPAELGWAACAEVPGGECARLEVPLDWDEPEGATIELALARTRARGERIGALVTNPGGPGASGVEFLAASPLPFELAERFDIVSWDPRGVGSSTAVSCTEGVDDLMSADPHPDDAGEEAELHDAARRVSEGCARSDGDLLPHVGTLDSARDLEAIRRALDESRLNYLGYSYGTQLGQAYAQMFGERIRAMVLDAVVDPSLGFEEFLVEQAVAFEASFDRHAAACDAAGPAACGVEDLATAYDEVLDRVEAAPLGPAGAGAGPSDLVIGALVTSYGTEGWRSLGPALAAALSGDGSELRRLADSYRDFGGYTSYAAVVCIDAPTPRGVEDYERFATRAEEAAPRFGAGVANELLPCATWPAEPVGRPMAVTAPDAPPILVVGNTGDAATPYENAVAVAGRLASGVLVTAEIDGHGASTSNPCVIGHVVDHFVRLAVPETDPHCT